MFGRANKDYEARKPLATVRERPPQKSSLEKSLFPSSSPRDSNTAASASLANFVRRPSSTFSKSGPTTTARPLGSRSPNIAHPPTYNPSTRNSSGFVTLCNNSGSFGDETLVSSRPDDGFIKTEQAGENSLLVHGFSLDDIIDDEDLDLEFQSPCALPPNPPQNAAPAPAPAPAPVPSSKNGTEKAMENGGFPANSGHSTISSWPSSSPSHLLPPAPGSINANFPLAKRSMTDGTAAASPLPAAKKRILPKDWVKTETNEVVSHGNKPNHSFATPVGKPKGIFPWDATASAVKVQKKQLKDQFKKPASTENGNDSHGDGPSDASNETAASSQKRTKPAVVSLSSEQQHVKNLVSIKGASVFFTGPAGTGKSVLMRAIIRDLQRKYAKDPEKLGVTASTGLAACNIGGMTLHSFAGIGLGKEDAQTLVRKIRRNPKAKARWLKTKTLVIDEISMVDGDLFDKLSQIGRTIRNNGRPWGGIQLVLTGDFFQLPPVPDREKRDVKFAFEAATWNVSIDHTIGLTEVFRQKDPEFAQMLNEMRLGRISEQTVQTFRSLARPLQFDDGLEVTELFPTRTEVDSSNERRLRALKGRSHRYDAFDSGDLQKRDQLLQNMMAPKFMELREGAQVMLIKNMDETLVNGSLGTVVKFMTESEYEHAGGDDFGLFADADTKKRAKILNRYLEGSGSATDAKVYPYVQFHAVDGSKRGILVRQEEWKVELPTGEVQASRRQLPLILAWALSIHKAQGQTLERVKVDLGRVFEKGQAYVALSRATTKHGLQVLRFEKHKVMAHPRVVGFYNKLYSAESAIKNRGDGSILSFARTIDLELDPPAPSFARKATKTAKGKAGGALDRKASYA